MSHLLYHLEYLISLKSSEGKLNPLALGSMEDYMKLGIDNSCRSESLYINHSQLHVSISWSSGLWFFNIGW